MVIFEFTRHAFISAIFSLACASGVPLPFAVSQLHADRSYATRTSRTFSSVSCLTDARSLTPAAPFAA